MGDTHTAGQTWQRSLGTSSLWLISNQAILQRKVQAVLKDGSILQKKLFGLQILIASHVNFYSKRKSFFPKLAFHFFLENGAEMTPRLQYISKTCKSLLAHPRLAEPV